MINKIKRCTYLGLYLNSGKYEALFRFFDYSERKLYINTNIMSFEIAEETLKKFARVIDSADTEITFNYDNYFNLCQRILDEWDDYTFMDLGTGGELYEILMNDGKAFTINKNGDIKEAVLGVSVREDLIQICNELNLEKKEIDRISKIIYKNHELLNGYQNGNYINGKSRLKLSEDKERIIIKEEKTEWEKIITKTTTYLNIKEDFVEENKFMKFETVISSKDEKISLIFQERLKDTFEIIVFDENKKIKSKVLIKEKKMELFKPEFENNLTTKDRFRANLSAVESTISQNGSNCIFENNLIIVDKTNMFSLNLDNLEIINFVDAIGFIEKSYITEKGILYGSKLDFRKRLETLVMYRFYKDKQGCLDVERIFENLEVRYAAEKRFAGKTKKERFLPSLLTERIADGYNGNYILGLPSQKSVTLPFLDKDKNFRLLVLGSLRSAVSEPFNNESGYNLKEDISFKVITSYSEIFQSLLNIKDEASEKTKVLIIDAKDEVVYDYFEKKTYEDFTFETDLFFVQGFEKVREDAAVDSGSGQRTTYFDIETEKGYILQEKKTSERRGESRREVALLKLDIKSKTVKYFYLKDSELIYQINQPLIYMGEEKLSQITLNDLHKYSSYTMLNKAKIYKLYLMELFEDDLRLEEEMTISLLLSD